MGRTILTVYANDEDVQLAKAKLINISAYFREMLKFALYPEEVDKGIEDSELKLLQSKLSLYKIELQKKSDEIIKLKKELEKRQKGENKEVRIKI